MNSVCTVQGSKSEWEETCISKIIISGGTVKGSRNDWEEICVAKRIISGYTVQEVGMTGKNLYSSENH
jgi:hypothetical protein